MRNVILYLLTGIILGYIFFVYTTGGMKRVSKKPKFGFIIQIYLRDRKCLHLHHWFQLSIILVILSVIYFFKKNIFLLPFMGFCIGGIIQGLTFSDRFSFITNCTEQYDVCDKNKKIKMK